MGIVSGSGWPPAGRQPAAHSVLSSLTLQCKYKSSIRNKSWWYCEIRSQLWNSVGSMKEYLRRAMQRVIYAGHAEKCMLVSVWSCKAAIPHISGASHVVGNGASSRIFATSRDTPFRGSKLFFFGRACFRPMLYLHGWLPLTLFPRMRRSRLSKLVEFRDAWSSRIHSQVQGKCFGV